MRTRHAFLVAPLVFLAPAIAGAQASDPVAARAHLQQGFALAEQGRCNEAIPYFVESIKLDRQPQALLNLGDCEEKIGNFGAASTHFIEARDLAQWQGLEPQRVIAEQRLQAIDNRLRRLVVGLAPDAPSGTAVARDGIDLGAGAASQPGDASPGNGQRIAGFGLMGIGAVGLVVGTIFGLKVSEDNRDSDSICPTGQPCPAQSVADYNHAVAVAKIDRASALIGFGVGAVFVGTGTVLVLTAPTRRASGMAVWLTPVVGSSGSGAAFSGSW